MLARDSSVASPFVPAVPGMTEDHGKFCRGQGLDKIEVPCLEQLTAPLRAALGRKDLPQGPCQAFRQFDPRSEACPLQVTALLPPGPGGPVRLEEPTVADTCAEQHRYRELRQGLEELQQVLDPRAFVRLGFVMP